MTALTIEETTQHENGRLRCVNDVLDGVDFLSVFCEVDFAVRRDFEAALDRAVAAAANTLVIDLDGVRTSTAPL